MKNLFKDDAPVSVKPVETGNAADVTFVAAGIKAAQNLPRKHRRSVVIDVCQALRCKPHDLEFLFDAANDDDDETVYDFPDSERRRMVIRYNNLDAAE